MESVVYYACKSIIKQLLLLFRAEKCIDILKCKATTIGQLKIIIIIEIKHLFQCPGQDRQQQPTVTHSIHTKHKKCSLVVDSIDIIHHTVLLTCFRSMLQGLYLSFHLKGDANLQKVRKKVIQITCVSIKWLERVTTLVLSGGGAVGKKCMPDK